MYYYDVFFKRYGVRLPQHLMSPIVSSLDKFEFPRNSLYHFHTHNSAQSGPDINDFYLRNFVKTILMDHVVKLVDHKGAPRTIALNVLPYLKEYHNKHRRFRYTRDMIQTHRDESILMIINYNFANKMYRYTRSMFAEYYKWWNVEKTVWSSISDAAKATNRQQFIFVDLPVILPSTGTLNNFARVFNSSILKYFSTPESLFILEMWKWLSVDHRPDSTMADIDKDSFHKINIVYKEGNSWCMLNLGILDDWRMLPGEPSDPARKVRIKAVDLQKRFLRMLMSLMGRRAHPVDPEQEAVEVKEEAQETPEEHLINEETHREKAVRVLENIDSDLDTLKVIEDRAITINEETISASATDPKGKFTPGKVTAQTFHKEETIHGAVVEACDKLADNGLLTASVYKNLVASAKSYQTIKAPDGKSTLEEFIVVKPEVIKITESRAIPDIHTVTDKSMLKSSLLEFDSKYVSKVFAKDVASMVVNIQKHGVILSDYSVEKVTDILGDSEQHTMRVRPVEGISSTLRFKLPAVDDEGVVTYNGNKYTLRKQRGD